MNYSTTMQLHLQQPLPYMTEFTVPRFCDKAYDLIMGQLAAYPIGTDACLECEAQLTAELCSVSPLSAYFRLPEESSEPIKTIQAGSYLFYQVPFAPTDGRHLLPLVNRFATDFDYSSAKKLLFFVRFYKEREYEIAVQFIAPKHTIEE